MTDRLAYTVAEAAELCGVSENTMRELIASKQIHAAKMGNLRIGRVELERYLLGIPRPAPDSLRPDLEGVATTAGVVATPGDLRRPAAMVGELPPRGSRSSRRQVR